MSDWKPELDAIIGARHGGQVDHVLGLLQKLDARFPNVPEIAYQLAWTCDVLGREAEAVPHYERAVALGLAPNELAGCTPWSRLHAASHRPTRPFRRISSLRARCSFPTTASSTSSSP